VFKALREKTDNGGTNAPKGAKCPPAEDRAAVSAFPQRPSHISQVYYYTDYVARPIREYGRTARGQYYVVYGLCRLLTFPDATATEYDDDGACRDEADDVKQRSGGLARSVSTVSSSTRKPPSITG